MTPLPNVREGDKVHDRRIDRSGYVVNVNGDYASVRWDTGRETTVLLARLSKRGRA